MFLSGLINGRRDTSDPLQLAELQEGLGSPPVEQFLPRRGPQAGGWGDAARAAARRAQAAAAEERRFEEGRRFKGINGYGYLPSGGSGEENELARALFAEGAGSPADMAAMASTIVNRVRPRDRPRASRPENRPTLSEVLRVPHQYSFQPNLDGNGPNGSALWALSGHPERMKDEQRRAWATAQDVAARALAGKLVDQTDGATFYFASHQYDGSPGTARGYFRHMLGQRRLRPSQYRSPYPRRPGSTEARGRPTFFFQHLEDFPAKQ